MHLDPRAILILADLSAFVLAAVAVCYVAGWAWCKRNPIEFGGSDVAHETGDVCRNKDASSDAQCA